MTKKSLKLLSLMLAFILTAGAFICAPMTAYADPYSVTGTCGKYNAEDINWYAFNDRTMVFLGQGAMQDYTLDGSSFSTAPWFGSNMSVFAETAFSTKIVVESGITTVGDYAFYLHPNYAGYVKAFMTISSIDLSDTVTSIGEYAFYNQKNIENINIPPTVTFIGTKAFGQCTSLESINYYGDPGTLTWEHSDGGYEFDNQGGSHAMTCHILSTYASQVATFDAKFASIGLSFTADLADPYETAADGIDRNIALYYGATNSKVFAGAAPYIVVGKFNGAKKSTTFGSNGFVSCVKVGGSYYLLTDHNGTLKEIPQANIDANGKATGTGNVYSALSLSVRHEYIGSNIVKVIYTLRNNTSDEISGISLGGSGDIKIGADDRAAVKPLNNSDEQVGQVGFYMSSGNDYDKSGDEYATLGFIAKHIVKQEVNGTKEYYTDAEFFYGEVSANLSTTASGTRDKHVFPQRIFEANSNSHSTDELASGTDAGMSYHWDNISLTANETKEFAVLYSVFGNNSQEEGQAMINDLTAIYHTVTWRNYDGSQLLKQAVKENATPVYSGPTPTKPNDTDYSYTFSGWSPAIAEVTGDAVYTAQFTPSPRPFFAKHSLTLNGDIGVNFLVDVTTISGLTPENIGDGTNGTYKVTLDFTWFDKHSTHQLAAGDYDSSLGLFRATCNVAAAEMMYPITATVYVDDVRQNGDKFTEQYRVRDYADVIRDPNSDFSASYSVSHPEEYAALVTLVKTMLDYGAKAQVVFDRHKDKDGTDIALANSEVSYTMEDHVIDAGVPEMESYDEHPLSELGLEYGGSTLILLTTTTLRHYYIVTDRTAFEAVKDTANFTYGTNKSYIYFEREGIAAADLAEPQVLEIGGHRYSYSVMQFAQKMQINNRPGEYALATALYHYNAAANTYFALVA